MVCFSYEMHNLILHCFRKAGLKDSNYVFQTAFSGRKKQYRPISATTARVLTMSMMTTLRQSGKYVTRNGINVLGPRIISEQGPV